MSASDSARAASLRAAMVERQIAARGVSDARVLAAMRSVPRHLFVPDVPLEDAYGDHPLPVGHGQTISQPFVVAAMLERLALAPGARVLDVGTGSGYQAAVLAAMGMDVDSIEVVPELFESGRARLESLGYRVRCRLGDGAQGIPERAPFDAIVLAAAPAALPAPLLAQLAEGGRLIAPIGTDRQQLELFTRFHEGVRRETLYPVRFVPMTGSRVEPQHREWT